MPYDSTQPTDPCTVCGSNANILHRSFGKGEVVNCSRCGDFQLSRGTVDDVGLPYTDPKMQALASHIIQKMQTPGARAKLTLDFFSSLKTRTLPSPAERTNNLITWKGEQADGSPGKEIIVDFGDPHLQAIVGVAFPSDIRWIAQSLHVEGLIQGTFGAPMYVGNLTARGWERLEQLKLAHIASRFAFFARKFDNPELDSVCEKCLRPAVAETGYELRPATQRAGLVDAIIEDEIRRCRFLIADLSDENEGAYWEAGFAEGLGKPVIYICRAKDGDNEKKIHFDANHRHTVRWDPSSLDQTALKLKAVIRNTLLGDAKQTD
jgi:hypothetical protein